MEHEAIHQAASCYTRAASSGIKRQVIMPVFRALEGKPRFLRGISERLAVSSGISNGLSPPPMAVDSGRFYRPGESLCPDLCPDLRPDRLSTTIKTKIQTTMGIDEDRDKDRDKDGGGCRVSTWLLRTPRSAGPPEATRYAGGASLETSILGAQYC